MNNFQIYLTDEFAEKLEEIAQKNLKNKLENYVYPQLKTNPYYGQNIKKLKGEYSGLWRYRIGKFRFFYFVDEQKKIVSMISADHRKDSY